MSTSWVRERGPLSRLRHEDIVSRSCPVQFRKSLRNNKSANLSRAVRSSPTDSNYPAGYVRRNIYIVHRGVTRDLHVPQKSSYFAACPLCFQGRRYQQRLASKLNSWFLDMYCYLKLLIFII